MSFYSNGEVAYKYFKSEIFPSFFYVFQWNSLKTTKFSGIQQHQARIYKLWFFVRLILMCRVPCMVFCFEWASFYLPLSYIVNSKSHRFGLTVSLKTVMSPFREGYLFFKHFVSLESWRQISQHQCSFLMLICTHISKLFCCVFNLLARLKIYLVAAMFKYHVVLVFIIFCRCHVLLFSFFNSEKTTSDGNFATTANWTSYNSILSVYLRVNFAHKLISWNIWLHFALLNILQYNNTDGCV